MGVIARFKDIMAANFNALLDKAENPEKMIDQYLRNLQNDLAKVKAETASVMAEEKSAKRKLDDCEAEIEKMGNYARKAVAAGNDGEARQFLAKKAKLESERTILDQNYTIACENSTKMREMHNKLESDIAELKNRQSMLKAKLAVAETKQKMNKLTSGVDSAGNNLASFDRMEEKVNRMLDEADAMAELNSTGDVDDISALERKYDAQGGDASIDDELAALKAEMGM